MGKGVRRGRRAELCNIHPSEPRRGGRAAEGGQTAYPVAFLLGCSRVKSQSVEATLCEADGARETGEPVGSSLVSFLPLPSLSLPLGSSKGILTKTPLVGLNPRYTTFLFGRFK